MPKRPVRYLSMLMLTLTACSLLPQKQLDGACARPDAPRLEGPNVVVYGSLDNFVESTCVLKAGCQQSSGLLDGPMKPGDGPRQEIEVAHDPDTCQSLFEVGTVEPGG